MAARAARGVKVSTRGGSGARGVVWYRASLDEVQEYVARATSDSSLSRRHGPQQGQPQQHQHQQQQPQDSVTIRQVRTFFRGWLEPGACVVHAPVVVLRFLSCSYWL